jgi:hypothetical protein
MSTRPELPRWTEGTEIPGPLRDLLTTSRDTVGSPAQVDRLAQALSLALGPEAGLGQVKIAPRASGLHFGSRAIGGLFGGAAAVVGVWWMMQTPAPPVSSPIVSPVTGESVPPQSAAELAPAELVAPAQAPVAPPEVAPLEVAPLEAAPLEAAPSEAARSSRPRSPSRNAPSEAELLARAQAALAAEPARAFALTREHRRRFPEGVLAQEREVIAIEALKRLGKQRAASDKAAAFEDRFPGSVHRERLEQTEPPLRERTPPASGKRTR